MYLCLAIFWFVVGVLLRIYWQDVQAFLHNDSFNPNVVSFVCFVLFCYNMIRWRMMRALAKLRDKAAPPPRRSR